MEPSTGTNLVAALACAEQMRQRGQAGAIVTLLCDAGDRYADSYYSDDWLQAQGLDCGAESDALDLLMDGGEWPAALKAQWGLAGELAT